jgi:hypothetical protein
MSNELIPTIHDHYKETCSIITEAIKRRDRLMLFVILTLGFFAFQTILPAISNTVVNDFLNFKFGLTLQLNLLVVGNIVWFLLLIFTLRYFQVAVFVERQYAYIHQLEEKLNKAIGQELITREGKSYYHEYPIFSDWMWLLYTVIFPTLLLIVGIAKITMELKNIYTSGWSVGLLLNTVSFALLGVSIILYLVVIHKKPKK